MLIYIKMSILREAEKIDEVAPGAVLAYQRLRNSHGQGIYTSLGRYYNHTIFARDAGMSAKFVSNFDHEAVWETILTLALHQGRKTNLKTQEEMGRIHHELRDYAAWNGRWYDRLGLNIAGRAWGMENRQLLSYYAADTTATYIRLVNKYVQNIDKSILDRHVPCSNGKSQLLRESLEQAANWIVDQVDSDGIFIINRTNRWSLPYQTFADSVTAYAWRDGKPGDVSKPHSYIEVQAYALDALEDAVRLMPSSESARKWRDTVSKMHKALFEKFWQPSRHVFAPGLFEIDGKLKPLDTDMVSVGWALNASFWQHMADSHHQARIVSMVKRLFREDFLTDVGLRTRSKGVPEPLGEMIDYHGSQTVWPMFNFMVIEGLRQHKLYRLARQLENRLINGVNAIGRFPEFLVVDHGGNLYRPDKDAKKSKKGQMIPEVEIAFTVVPTLTLAYRHSYKRSSPASSGWRYNLEKSVLSEIPNVELMPANEAAARLSPEPLRIKRTRAGIKSALFIAPTMIRRPR